MLVAESASFLDRVRRRVSFVLVAESASFLDRVRRRVSFVLVVEGLLFKILVLLDSIVIFFSLVRFIFDPPVVDDEGLRLSGA